MQEQKQYENLSFTVDDLLILQDKHNIDNFVKPEKFFANLYSWLNLPREKKQKIISTYIDNFVVVRKNDKTIIKETNFRSSFISDMIMYHEEYGLPLNFPLLRDDYGYSLPMNKEIKTTEQANNYFNKLVETLGSEYKLNYYEIETNDDLTDLGFDAKNEIEKIIRVIAINDSKKFKDDNLKFGIITVDLTDIIAPNGEQLYKGFFEKFKEMCDNELCDI